MIGATRDTPVFPGISGTPRTAARPHCRLMGTKQTSRNVGYLVAFAGKADIRPIYEYAHWVVRVAAASLRQSAAHADRQVSERVDLELVAGEEQGGRGVFFD